METARKAVPTRESTYEVGYTRAEALRHHQEMTLENWSNGGRGMRYVFLSMPEFFPQATIHRSGDVSRLPRSLRDDVQGFTVETQLGRMSLDEYVRTAPVNGVIVLHRGQIVYESYPRMRSFDKHLHMSVSKAFVATVIAILEDRGLVDVSEPVDAYLPEVQGSGWQGVCVRDVLDMASGIDCLEMAEGAYSDPAACYYQYEASLGWLRATQQTPPSVYDLMAALKRKEPPGQAFEYTSVNTFLLSWLAERITGKLFSEILTKEIWSKIGAESDASISVSRHERAAISHGGICTTLRDLARFGLLFTPSYPVVSVEKVISDSYLDKIMYGGRPEILYNGTTGLERRERQRGDPPKHNSYQWDWVMPDNDFYKGGYGGQGLYISPERDVVLAFFGTPFDAKNEAHELALVARQMARSGLFG